MSSHPSILVFATQHMPTGGIESHLKEFCLHLTKSGVSIDLVITNSAMLPETENHYRKVCRRVYLGKYNRSFLRFIWLAFTGIKLSFIKYTALYSNGQGNSIDLFSTFLLKKGKWVHHHHMSGDISDQETWEDGYKRTMQKANNIIACAWSNADNMRKLLKRPIDVIPCFSRQITVPTKSYLKRSLLHFGYYGRLIREKGVELICQLSNDPDLDDVKFHIWGEGEDYPSSYFDNYERLKYHGKFSEYDELTTVISSLDAYLLLSTHPEGLPISLLEAMSAGLPWLATDCGGIANIACDELSTRTISASSNYSQIKSAVLLLKYDLQAGIISERLQKSFYDQNFSSVELVSEWRKILGLDTISKQMLSS